MNPILLDTDPGSDIDDAVALAYLLANPDCELVGITTVTGNTQQRAASWQDVCEDFGRSDVPIYAGISEPRSGPGQPNVPHFPAVEDRVGPLNFPTEAVEFLRSTIRSRPGEITLLTVGPFTNIAALLELDPEIPSLCRSIVSMAGSFRREDHREWNCTVDPASTKLVYGAVTDHLSVGLDVTMKCQMTPAEVEAKFTDPRFASIRAMASKWFSGADHITFHDPLAAALIFRPELCGYVSGQVSVGDAGETTFADEASSHRAGSQRIADTVDSDGFFREYFRHFS